MFKASAATLLLFAMSASAQPLAVTFVNTANLPSQAPNQLGQPVTIAGLSGIVYAGGTRWLAVMDNSNKVIELDVMLSASGTITGSSVTRVFDLAETRDFEDIALVEGASDEVWLCEEGTPAVQPHHRRTPGDAAHPHASGCGTTELRFRSPRRRGAPACDLGVQRGGADGRRAAVNDHDRHARAPCEVRTRPRGVRTNDAARVPHQPDPRAGDERQQERRERTRAAPLGFLARAGAVARLQPDVSVSDEDLRG
jgi:hypothetical protein